MDAEQTCNECGKEFLTRARRPAKNCSQQCRYSAQSKRQKGNVVLKGVGPRRPNKHGKSRRGQMGKLYNVWRGARQRCMCKPNSRHYKRYAGRGITFARAWDDFEVFEKWAIESGYREGLSIDRINNDIGYSPENCRWATPSQQQRNTSKNKFNNDSIAILRHLRKRGLRYKQLAKIFHAHPVHLSKICNGGAWK